MSYFVTFSERAFAELLDSWTWYEDRQEGLGDEFKNIIDRKLLRYLLTLILALKGNEHTMKSL